MKASSYLHLSTGIIIDTFLLVINLYKDKRTIQINGKSRYPGQADLLNKEWESWAPLLFFGRERQLPGKEDRQIVGEVRVEEYVLKLICFLGESPLLAQ